MRKSTIAGSWYPGNEAKLRGLVEKLLAEASFPELHGRPAGIISPHAGIQFSGAAAACGFKALRGRKVQRVILMGPSHYTYMHGIAVSGVSSYETPLGRIPIDRDICESLAENPLFQGPAHAELPEHSLEMQLPFLQTVLEGFTLVPMVVGELERPDYIAAASALCAFIDAETVVVASSDFTHYGPRFGYVPFRDNIRANLEKLDGGAIGRITALDVDGFLDYVDSTGATICGARPIGILLNLLPQGARATKLSYYTSGDMLQDYTDSVSYASIVFTTPE